MRWKVELRWHCVRLKIGFSIYTRIVSRCKMIRTFLAASCRLKILPSEDNYPAAAALLVFQRESVIKR